MRFTRTMPNGDRPLAARTPRTSPHAAAPLPTPGSDESSSSPGLRVRQKSSHSFPQIVIERVLPELDGGRHPVKRVAGDEILVSADIYKDGHDLLDARVCFRAEGEAGWRTAAMRYDYDSDRWSGSFVADRVGRWTYTVEAWADQFG